MMVGMMELLLDDRLVEHWVDVMDVNLVALKAYLKVVSLVHSKD